MNRVFWNLEFSTRQDSKNVLLQLGPKYVYYMVEWLPTQLTPPPSPSFSVFLFLFGLYEREIVKKEWNNICL